MSAAVDLSELDSLVQRWAKHHLAKRGSCKLVSSKGTHIAMAVAGGVTCIVTHTRGDAALVALATRLSEEMGNA